MITPKPMMKLKLPKIAYGTICLKILQEFIQHHNLPSDLPLPEGKEATHEALEKIFNIIVASMGDKAEDIIRDAMSYYHDLPPNVR